MNLHLLREGSAERPRSEVRPSNLHPTTVLKEWCSWEPQQSRTVPSTDESLTEQPSLSHSVSHSHRKYWTDPSVLDNTPTYDTSTSGRDYVVPLLTSSHTYSPPPQWLQGDLRWEYLKDSLVLPERYGYVEVWSPQLLTGGSGFNKFKKLVMVRSL